MQRSPPLARFRAEASKIITLSQNRDAPADIAFRVNNGHTTRLRGIAPFHHDQPTAVRNEG